MWLCRLVIIETGWKTGRFLKRIFYEKLLLDAILTGFQHLPIFLKWEKESSILKDVHQNQGRRTREWTRHSFDAGQQIWTTQISTFSGVAQAKDGAWRLQERWASTVRCTMVTALAHHSSSKIEITKCFVYARGICWGRKHFFLLSSKWHPWKTG